MKAVLLAGMVLTASIGVGQMSEAARLNQHRVTNRSSPAPESGAERAVIQPNGPEVDPEWRAFFDRWLRVKPEAGR
jgi:hypothetical protein